jgi:PAS domain S-box-containing protein
MVSERPGRVRPDDDQTVQAAARLAAIVESSGDAIIGKTLDAIITDWNAGAEHMYGYTAEEVIGKPLAILVPPDRSEELATLMERLRRGERITHFETERVCKDGRRLHVSLSISPIRDSSGAIIGAATIARDITDLKRTEEALRQSRDQMQAIINSIGDGLTVQGPAGNLLFANLQAARMVALPSAEAMLATPPGELLQNFELLDEHGHPFPVDELPGRRVLRGEPYAERVVGFRRLPDGPVRWSLVRSRPIRDEQGQVQAAVNIFQDITEQKHVEQTLRFLAEAASALAESLDYETTLQRIAQLAVPQVADWCAVDILVDGQVRRLAVAHIDPAKVAWAQELYERYPPDLEAPHGLPNVLRTGRSEFYPQITDEMLVRAAGSDEDRLRILRTVGFQSAMIVPLVARGQTIGAISFVAAESGHHFTQVDLSLAEQLAHHAALAIDNARLYQEAQQVARMRQEFLSIASHELKTPLTTVKVYTQLLERELHEPNPDPEGLSGLIADLQGQVSRMETMVSDFLDATRMQQNRLELRKEEVDLVALVRSLLARFEPSAAESGHRLVRAGDESIRGCWDASRLDQVITNLVSNALKFSPAGGEVRVEVRQQGSQALVSVTDQGIGISPEDQAAIFQPFMRGSGSRGISGTGLGLYIAAQIVERHGGRLALESEVGKGSRFTVALPLRLDVSSPPPVS